MATTAVSKKHQVLSDVMRQLTTTYAQTGKIGNSRPKGWEKARQEALRSLKSKKDS